MRFGNRSADGEAESGACGLGGAEGVKDTINEICGHPGAAVADLDAQRLVTVVPGGDADFPLSRWAFRERLDRVA